MDKYSLLSFCEAWFYVRDAPRTRVHVFYVNFHINLEQSLLNYTLSTEVRNVNAVQKKKKKKKKPPRDDSNCKNTHHSFLTCLFREVVWHTHVQRPPHFTTLQSLFIFVIKIKQWLKSSNPIVKTILENRRPRHSMYRLWREYHSMMIIKFLIEDGNQYRLMLSTICMSFFHNAAIIRK